MSNYDARELEDVIDEYFGDNGIDWDEVQCAIDGSVAFTLSFAGEPVDVVKIDDHGGTGGEAYIVVRVGDQFFKKDGYYESHDGYYWDGYLHEVSPRPKTITVYEPV